MKSFKQLIGGLDEARLFASYQDAANSAGPGQKPKLDAASNKYILVREETIAEAQVSTKNYSWGTMKTIHHGSDFSIPLHPEHHEAIAKLKDEQEHNFKTEDGKHWTARRKGDDVHFQGANNGGTTKVPHSTMKEGYDDNRRGFGKRPREDDEYHVPDPQVKKNKIKEAKDEKEYGYEGDMALNQLKTLVRCAEMIEDMLKPDTDLPEWVQSKITLATDYIQTAADYMYSEMNEELKGGQKKLDKNKNGKLDSQDFKILRKEEVLDEANHREFASQGKMHPDMAKHMKTGEHMDYYEPKTGDKVHGKVMKNDGKEVHVKQSHDSYDSKKVGSVHKFTVSNKLDDVNEAVQKADIPAYLRKAKGEKPLELKDLKRKDTISDAENLAKNRGVKEQQEGNMKTYKEFVTEIKMSDLPRRSIKGSSYGAQYDDPEGADDADNKKPAKAADAPKRGRGRPAGSMSGARQQGSAKQSKTGGADYTGFKLHLPNSNK